MKVPLQSHKRSHATTGTLRTAPLVAAIAAGSCPFLSSDTEVMVDPARRHRPDERGHHLSVWCYQKRFRRLSHCIGTCDVSARVLDGRPVRPKAPEKSHGPRSGVVE